MSKMDYNELTRSYFSKLPMPITERQQAVIEEACSLQPQTRYIYKSQRSDELSKELELLSVLYTQLDEVKRKYLDSNGRELRFRHINYGTSYFEYLPYWKYRKDGVRDALEGAVKDAHEESWTKYRFLLDNYMRLYTTLTDAYATVQRDAQAEAKGSAGEDAVFDYLTRALNCRVLSNVILPSAEIGPNAPKTAESDLLIISGNGIYVCEVKNYGKAGQTLTVDPNGKIVKWDRNGYKLEEFASPFAQNAHHCEAVSKLLTQAGITEYKVIPVVVIASTDVVVENSSKFSVMDKYQLVQMITAEDAENIYSASMQNKAYDAIQKARLGERKFPMLSISNAYPILSEAATILMDAVKNRDEYYSQTNKSVSEYIESINKVWLQKHKVQSFIGKQWKRIGYFGIIRSLIWGLAFLGFLCFWFFADGRLRMPNVMTVTGFCLQIFLASCALTGLDFAALRIKGIAGWFWVRVIVVAPIALIAPTLHLLYLLRGVI